MSYAPRSASRGGSMPATPIATTYGLTVLAALVVLVLLHRAFGSVHIEGGLK